MEDETSMLRVSRQLVTNLRHRAKEEGRTLRWMSDEALRQYLEAATAAPLDDRFIQPYKVVSNEVSTANGQDELAEYDLTTDEPVHVPLESTASSDYPHIPVDTSGKCPRHHTLPKICYKRH